MVCCDILDGSPQKRLILASIGKGRKSHSKKCTVYIGPYSFEPKQEVFTDKVEIDETWVGGKEKHKHANKRTQGTPGRSAKKKTPVLGILERDGKVYALPVADTKAKTLVPIIDSKVVKGSKIYTDEWKSYRILGQNYDHKFVKHSANQYVDGSVHTNNIENFWSLLKSGIDGIYHHVSDKHLSRYVNEFISGITTGK